MHGRIIPGLVFLTIFFGPVAAHSDEIRLKDGTKITGTIVGFEADSFRVETAYGFALIRKDKVADINITANTTPNTTTPKPEAKKDLEVKKDSESKNEAVTKKDLEVKIAPPAKPESSGENGVDAKKAPKKEPDPKAKPVTASATSAPAGRTSGETAARSAAPTVSPSVATESLPPASGSVDLKSARSETVPTVTRLAPATAAKSEPALAKTKTVAAAPPATVLPPPPPEPPVIRDEIRGNVYANLTYGFQMYKPPSWELIPAARKALPDAVAALGTYDQTTLLVIGRERAKDSLDAHAAATGKALSGVYENYRLITSKHVSLAGFPAIEQHARGTVDGRDWSVVLLTFLKGDDAFTLLGMTWADSDLIQVQENVISKTVNSLTFVAK